jgi:GDPmannose 4,6-dehydratase
MVANMKKALVFGGLGQIGSYLLELLQEKGYITKSVRLLSHEAGDQIGYLLESWEPDEVYNMSAMMYAPDSWKDPVGYMECNGLAVLEMMAVLRGHKEVRFFQAGSAEVFEKASVIQAEDTNRLPENPYGLSKMLAMESVRIFREKYGLFACTGIFLNAESPRRKNTFFAKRAAMEVARIKRELGANGSFTPAQFGKLEARRDWGWAPEYAEVAWKMMQLPEPVDLVIGTGESRTCREFVLECLKAAQLLEPEKRFDEYVKYEKVKEYVMGDTMRADASKAKLVLGWQAQYKYADVARMLVESELAVQKETFV